MVILLTFLLGIAHGHPHYDCGDYDIPDLLVYTYDYPDQPPILDIEVVEPEPEKEEPADQTTGLTLSPEMEEVIDYWNKFR